MKLFKWRLRLVQKGYDLGWQHGYEVGAVEKHHQIIELLVKHIENIDWLKEEPLEVREILPIVKNHREEQGPIGWEK